MTAFYFLPNVTLNLCVPAAVYAIVVRTSEYDLPPEILDDIIAQSMSKYAYKEKRSNRDGGSDDEHEYNY